MILIGLGANLSSSHGTPLETLIAAREALAGKGVSTLKSSRVWLSAPVPFDPDQDWFHNAVISVDTVLNPQELLDIMLEIETQFGRVRSVKNAPRVLDLDLIAYHDEVIKNNDTLILPHPRMNERLFVLKPLGDINQNWTHPISGHNIENMVTAITDDQPIKPLEGAAGW